MPEEERARVNTYVPQYQKDAWVDHAEELDMSQSEFVRTMVQAGRRGFDGGNADEASNAGAGRADPGKEPATNSGNGAEPREGGSRRLEARVRAVLGDGKHRSWDELVAALTEDMEDRLEETLQELQAENEVVYSGRHDGYTLVEP